MKHAKDLAAEIGVTYRQVWHWTSKGYVVSVSPDLDKPNGIDFDPFEERVLRTMAWLVKFGMKPEPASVIARNHVSSGDKQSYVTIPGVGLLIIGG